MRFRALIPFLVSLCAIGAAVPSATAAALPAGPRLAFVEAEFSFSRHRRPGDEGFAATRIVSADPNGNDRRPLLGSKSIFVGARTLSWSADGSEVAFFGKPGAEPSESVPWRAYVADLETGTVHVVPGTKGGNGAVLSPDGQSLAFYRDKGSSGASVWLAPTGGGKARRLTPSERGKAAVPSAFSPDGSTLLVSVSGREQEVEAIDLATGIARIVEVEAAEATYSPDGSKIAFVSYRDHETVSGVLGTEETSEVYVANADGSGAVRVTHTPKSDESEPSWDASGERLVYERSPGGLLGLLKGKVVESNADGTCVRAIDGAQLRRKGAKGLVAAPSWVPGDGRGAGPISC